MKDFLMRSFYIFSMLVLIAGLVVFTKTHGQEMISFMSGPVSVSDADKEKEFEVTGIHRALTMEDDWLNTSRPLKAEDLMGRVILVDFWTYCCINCIHVIPKLQKLEEEFGDRLAVIGVHSAKFANEGERENIRKAMLRYGVHHPVVNDKDFRIWQEFGARAWPTLLLIDPQGKIVRKYSGEGNVQQMRQDIAALLDGYGESVVVGGLPFALEKDKEPTSILKFPSKITVAQHGGETALFITDSGHNRIVGTREDGTIFVTIGAGKAGFADGTFDAAQFNQPQGTIYKDGKLYIADTVNHRLRVADLETKTVSTLAGTGARGGIIGNPMGRSGLSEALASPWDLAFYPDASTIAIANAGTHQLVSYDIAEKVVKPLAGNGRESIDDGVFPVNSLSQPSGFSRYGDKLYFVDSETSALRVLKGREVETLIGTGLFDFGFKDGKQGDALMQHPLGLVAVDGGVYIVDSYNHAIRFYDVGSKVLSTALRDAGLNEPNDIVIFGDGFLVTDTNNHRIVKLKAVIPNTLQGGGISSQKQGDFFPLRQGYAGQAHALEMTGTFTVMPPKKPMAYADTLPNLLTLDKQSVTVDAAIDISLRDGWKINDDAPSYLAVFNADKNLVQAWDKRDILKAVIPNPSHEKGEGRNLPETEKSQGDFSSQEVVEMTRKYKINMDGLEIGQSYTLQGILYYCEDKPDSLCLIKGVEAPLHVTEDGQGELSIELK